MISRLQKPLLLALFLLISFAILNPNPFGNNPDAIGDESYFLTSALSGIEKNVPPGLEFSRSGNYYGGVQTYLDTAVLIPVIGAVFVANTFSLLHTKIQVALHTGNLLGVLRFINSFLFVVTCGFGIYYCMRRKIPAPLAERLLLLLLLLLGNSLVIGFAHTAKVWTLYLLLDSVIGALFIAQEYYLSRGREPFIRKDIYIACMVWAAALAFFQNYVGMLPIALWMLYAVVLRHIMVQEIWRYILQRWYIFTGLLLLNSSFLYRAAFVKNHSDWWDPGDIAVKSAAGTINWFNRLYDPVAYAVASQPFLLLFLGGLVILPLLLRKADTRRKLYLAIAGLHPIFVFVVFHVLLGFSLFPRYSLALTIATSFAIIMIIGEIRLLRLVAIIASALLAVAVMIHAVQLYWKSSSEVILTETLLKEFNSPQNVFILEPQWPKTMPLSLPLNSSSLLELNERQQNMTRHSFLRAQGTLIDQFVSFKPLVLMPDSSDEEMLYRSRFTATKYNVWVITMDCHMRCTDTERTNRTCFEVNASACSERPQEIHTLPDFLSYTQLGGSYIVRKTSP